MAQYSVPVPTTFRDTDDRFASILVGAPDFEFLNQSGFKYTITLDMMMDSLRLGIDAVARSAKNPEAAVLFQQCRAEVDAVHELYRQKRIEEAQQRIFAAQQLFKQAGKLRNKKGAA